MSDGTGTVEDEVSKEIAIDGIKLQIVAYGVDGEGWALCVINELGIRSHWSDFFKTAQDAIRAAEMAIESEGVEPFLSAKDFGYLLH